MLTMDLKLRSIVLVDMDETKASAYKILLEQMQVVKEIFVFSDGLNALKFIKEKYLARPASQESKHADLIILDIDMPGFGGFEILYILKELKKVGHIHLHKPHFAVLTAKKTDREILLASRYEVNTVLEKPLRQQDISDLINKLHA